MQEEVFVVWLEELHGFMESLTQEELGVALHRVIIGMANEISDLGAYKVLRFVQAEMDRPRIII